MASSFTIANLIKQINNKQITKDTSYTDFKNYYLKITRAQKKDELMKALILNELTTIYGPFLEEIRSNKLKKYTSLDSFYKDLDSYITFEILLLIAQKNPELKDIHTNCIPYFIPKYDVYTKNPTGHYSSTFYRFYNNLISEINTHNTYNNFLNHYIRNENFPPNNISHIIFNIKNNTDFVNTYIQKIKETKSFIVDKDINNSYLSKPVDTIINQYELYVQLWSNLILNYKITLPFENYETSYINNPFKINPTFLLNVNIFVSKYTPEEKAERDYRKEYGYSMSDSEEDEESAIYRITNIKDERLKSFTFDPSIQYIQIIIQLINGLINKLNPKNTEDIKRKANGLLEKLGQFFNPDSRFFTIIENIKNTDEDNFNKLLEEDLDIINESDIRKAVYKRIFKYWYNQFKRTQLINSVDLFKQQYVKPIDQNKQCIHEQEYINQDIKTKLGQKHKDTVQKYIDLCLSTDLKTINTIITNKFENNLNIPDNIYHLTPLAYAVISQNTTLIKALITTSAVFSNQSTVGKRRIYYDKILDCISVQDLAYMTQNTEVISLVDEKINLMNRWKNYNFEETIQKMRDYIKTLPDSELRTDLESIYNKSKNEDIKKRILNEDRIYYHQTQPDVASIIGNTPLHEYWFLAGAKGMYGPGIYFAKTPKETDIKALSKGTTLKGTVFLGKPYMIHSHYERDIFQKKYGFKNDSDLLHHALKLKGFDSVIVVRKEPFIKNVTFMNTGNEYIVYNTEQVMDVKIMNRPIFGRKIGGNKETLIDTLIRKPLWLDAIIEDTPSSLVNLNQRWLLETTPLMIACAQGKLNIVQGLINTEPLEDVDAFGRNALFYAIQGGNKEIVQLLMNQGIDIFKQDSYGKFAVEYFSVKKHFKFTEKYIFIYDTNMMYRNIVLNKLNERFITIYNKPRDLSDSKPKFNQPYTYRRGLSDSKPKFNQPYTYRRGISDSRQILPKLVNVKPVAKKTQSRSTKLDINNLVISKPEQIKRLRSSSSNNNEPIKKIIKKSSSQTTYDPNNDVQMSFSNTSKK